MTTRATLSALVVGTLLISACTGTDEHIEPTLPPAVPARPSPTVSPDGVQELSDPDLGIVFEDVPDLTGDEADVYDTVALFKKAYWSTMTTNEVHPSFDVIASPELKAGMGRVMEKNVAIDADISGTYSVRISDVAVTGDGEATAAACADYSGASFVSKDGSFTPEEAGFGTPQVTTYTLRHLGNTWQVATGEVTGPC